MKLLSKKFHYKEGVVKINTHNCFQHELAKFLLCWQLAKEGKEFVSEAVFSNSNRADVFCLDDKEALEVLHSETLEMFKKKVVEFPCAVFAYKSDEVLELHGVSLKWKN